MPKPVSFHSWWFCNCVYSVLRLNISRVCTPLNPAEYEILNATQVFCIITRSTSDALKYDATLKLHHCSGCFPLTIFMDFWAHVYRKRDVQQGRISQHPVEHEFQLCSWAGQTAFHCSIPASRLELNKWKPHTAKVKMIHTKTAMGTVWNLFSSRDWCSTDANFCEISQNSPLQDGR